MRISREFLVRLKLHQQPAYKIAQHAGVNPNWLSRVINGIEELKPYDRRIIAVGRILGLAPGQCFEKRNEPEFSGGEEQ